MLPPLLLPAEDELDLDDEPLEELPDVEDGVLRSHPPRSHPPPPMKTGGPQEGPKKAPPTLGAQALARAENQINAMNSMMAMSTILFIVLPPPL